MKKALFPLLIIIPFPSFFIYKTIINKTKPNFKERIMWNCINLFIKETGIKSGQWFEIFIKNYYININKNEIFEIDYAMIFDPDIYFIGRYEINSIHGSILRKP